MGHLEFLTCALSGDDKASHAAAIPGLIEGGNKICLALGAKLLKIPFPGSAQACANITAMAGEVPWAVLSAGVDHAIFLGQDETAMANGAAGVIAGRSLWKDCNSLDRAVTKDRLTTIALPRLREIRAVIGRYLLGR